MAKKIDYASLYTLRSDGRYMGYYHGKDGKRHAAYSKDPKVLYQIIQEKEYTSQKHEETPFEEIADQWDEENAKRVSDNTRVAYTASLSRLKDNYRGQPLKSITPQSIEMLLSELKHQGFAKRTVQLHRDLLNQIFRWAIVQEYTDSNPIPNVKMPSGMKSGKRTIPKDSIVLSVAQSTGKPFALFAQICLYAGLRRGEALALRYEDIDRKNNLIHITKAVTFDGNQPVISQPKTEGSIRNVILLDTLAELIPKKKKGYIFPANESEDKPMTKTQIRNYWAAYCKEIGAAEPQMVVSKRKDGRTFAETKYRPTLTIHQLRHSFATFCLEAGLDEKDTMEQLGHSSITTTKNIYQDIRADRKQNSASRLNQYLSSTESPTAVKTENVVNLLSDTEKT